jgi:ribonuclease R
MSAIGNEYFHFDAEANTLMGADTGRIISLGQRATVRLAEAAPLTGGIALELLELDGKALAQGRRSPAGRSPRRRNVKARRKSDKIKRKVKRSRR